MKFAAPPDVLYWSPRSGEHGDCVVAAIELACGVTYEVSLTACAKVKPEVLKLGMTWGETKKTLKALGFVSKLVPASRVDLEEGTGLLHVYTPKKMSTTSHAVYLWEGRIIEPMSNRRQLWLSAKSFLNHYRYKAGGLLVVEQKED